MIDLTKFDGDIALKGKDGKDYTVDAEEVLLWAESLPEGDKKPNELEFCAQLADFIEENSKPDGLKLSKSKSLRVRHAMHCWMAIQNAVQEYQRFFAREFDDTPSSEAPKAASPVVQSHAPPTPMPQ